VVKVDDLDEELLSSAVLGDETVVDAAHLERFLRGEEKRLDALGVVTYCKIQHFDYEAECPFSKSVTGIHTPRVSKTSNPFL
jgi:hypothetical protein